MANARFAWGIDVGNRALKAVKLVRDSTGLRVDDFEVIEHETVLSNAGDNREALIQSALSNFVQRHSFKGGVASVGVSGQASFARFIKLPPVESKKILEIVRFEAIQQIPFPLDDVEWSHQLFQSPDSPEVEVGIFAMRKDLINQHIQYFTDVDLNVQTVQMSPLAVYNAMYYDQRINDTTLIIDLGAENADLIIAEGEAIWLRSIPIGGNNFTEALVKSFRLNFAKAEELKRNAATSKYARQIFQAMRPVFADLVAEIQRSIGFYSSVHRESRIRKAIATGGGFRLPQLQKYLQQNLQLEVSRIDRLGAGAPADGKLATTFNENLLSMVSAYGLAVQAMGDGKITSSLLPQHIRREKLWQEKTKWFGAAAALFVLGTGVALGSYYMEDWKIGRSDFRQDIERVLTQAEKLSGDWDTIEQSGTADRQRIANIKSLEAYRGIWFNLLTDIHNALPQPREEVLSGDVEKIKAIPRTERNLLLIDSITSAYHSDINSALTTLGGNLSTGGLTSSSDETEAQEGYAGQSPGGGSLAIPAGARGFIITINCTTPNADAFALIDQTFIKSLLARDQNAAPEKGYYIANAVIDSAKRLGENTARLAEMERVFNAAMANRPQPLDTANYVDPNNAGILEPVENPHVDRLTFEDVKNDWEVVVHIAVVLDPPAPPAAAVAAR